MGEDFRVSTSDPHDNSCCAGGRIAYGSYGCRWWCCNEQFDLREDMIGEETVSHKRAYALVVQVDPKRTFEPPPAAFEEGILCSAVIYLDASNISLKLMTSQ